MTVKHPSWQTGGVILLALLLLALMMAGLNVTFGAMRFLCPIHGVAAALLVLFGRRYWFFTVPALVALPLWSGFPPGLAVGQSLISLGAILLACRLLQPLRMRTRLRLAETLRLMLGCGLLVSILTVSLSLLLHAALGQVPVADIGAYRFFSGWMAEASGYLIAVPILLSYKGGWREIWRRRGLEMLLALATTSAGVWLLYGKQDMDAGGWQFLFFPLMIWVALRLGQGGAALVSLTMSVSLGLVLTVTHGALTLPVQLLALNLMITGLLLAASSEEERSAKREIAAEHNTLDAILNALPLAIYKENSLGRLVYANRAFSDLTGQQTADLMGSSSARLRQRLDLPAVLPPHAGDGFECTVNGQTDPRTLQCKLLPLFDAEGNHYGDCFMAMDITERLAFEQQLRLGAQVFDSASEGIVVADAHGRITAVNPAFTRITGYAAEEAIGRTSEAFCHLESNTVLGRQIQASLERDGLWQGELPGRRKSGDLYPAWGSLSAVRDESRQVTHYVAVFSDFTARKEVEGRLQFLAQRDPLTLLHNRSALQDKLTSALQHAALDQSRLALFFIDLDRFKIINDSLGHAIGDELLQVVALRLGHCLKSRDFIARFGGDEFTVLIENAPDDQELAAIAERIIGEIARSCIVRGHDLFVTCSIGVSRYPDDARDATTLMRMADMAMYRAKEQGKNTFQLHANDMSEQVSERNQLEGRLRNALVRNQFVLHFQPLYDLACEDYYGVEALLRWQHPELGMVPPASFIPLAEESGMIEALGTWVIHEACRQLRAWLDDGIDPRLVSVNLSPRQFKRGQLVEVVQRALDGAGLEPERLTLEITESIIMQNPDEAREILTELREMGVRVAIDDFGSGYSSLAYLKLFPLDTLKIDRAFIAPLPDDQNSAAIVEAVVAMSRKLKLAVVAEGVETSGQSAFLRSIGCDVAQGFLYSPPLPADQLPTALRPQDLPSQVY